MKVIKTFLGTTFIAMSMATISANANADTYFSCTSGYTFQVKNGAARCYKPSGYVYKPLNRCGSVFIPGINKRIGHFYKRNHQGNKDMCVGQFKIGPVTNVNAVEIACPSGYSKQITSGKDKCRKFVSAKTVPPTRAVNR